jgi:hypothetical protein
MNEKIDKMGVIWLSRAEKLFDKDLTFRKEYDYIHAALTGKIDV